MRGDVEPDDGSGVALADSRVEDTWLQPAYGLRDDGKCTQQECGATCCPQACAVSPSATHHLLYMHTQHTGGDAIECGTQAWQAAGWWTNMGHTNRLQVDRCEARCGHSVHVCRVVSVRNPYDYWQAVYKAAWHGRDAALTAWLNWHTLQWTLRHQREGILRSFGHFLQWVEGEADLLSGQAGLSQSARVFAACGDPCEYDALLRTEDLENGWRALLHKYGLPTVQLPDLGDFNATLHADDSPSPPATFTPETVGIVNRIDAPIFDRFGYTRRDAPLVASVSVQKADVVSVCAGLIAATVVLGCIVVGMCCCLAVVQIDRIASSRLGTAWRSWWDRHQAAQRAFRLHNMDSCAADSGAQPKAPPRTKIRMNPKTRPPPSASGVVAKPTINDLHSSHWAEE